MFEPGTQVEIEDNYSARFPQATVVQAETREARELSGHGYPVEGYIVRYDNGCEIWVREWRVRELVAKS